MNLNSFREYCLSKKGVKEDFPFGESNPVYKVGGKIFAIATFDTPLWVNLKCEPELAVELRERYEDVNPGYHMNKKHWNTVGFMGNIPEKELKKMIDHSYELVINGLSRKIKMKLLVNLF